MFVQDIPKGLLICHTCDNPKCIHPDHLYLGTQKQNVKDITDRNRWPIRTGELSTVSKLTERDVLEIRRKYIPWKYSCQKLAHEFGVDMTNIWLIIKRKTWSHI